MNKLKISIIVFILGLFFTPLVSADLSDGLQYYYSFDDADISSNTLIDLHGNNNATESGTLTTGQTGKLNEAVLFPGGGHTADKYTSDNNIFPLASTDEFTISFWYYYPSDPQLRNTFFLAGSHTDINVYWMNQQDSGTPGNEAVRFYVEKDDGSNFDCTIFATGYNDVTTLYHAVGVIDATDKECRVYINNVEIKSVYDSGFTGLKTQAVNYYIGYDTQTADPRSMDGIIDEMGIWNRALNTTEISQLYNSGAGISYENITATASPSTPTASERLQQDSSLEQNATVTVNSPSYVQIMSSSINITSDTYFYGSASVPLIPSASNTATCRINFNGTELNETETSRSLTAGSVGNMLITSLYHYAPAGVYDVGLSCYRGLGGSYQVQNSSILFHYLTTPTGTPLEKAQLNFTTATLPGLLGSTTITTSDNYTAAGLERYLVMDYAANYVYGATGNITVITEVAGVNCSAVKRYGTSGSTGSVGGNCFVDLGNETNSTTYDIKVYGIGTGSVTNAKFHVKEFIIHENEINGTNITGLSGSGTIDSFNISVNAGHSTPDLIIQGILSVLASSPSTTGQFYMTADGQNSTLVGRTSSPGQPGVLGIHKDIETVSGTVLVSLIGNCANCSFTGENILAYVSSDLPATPNEFVVTAKNVYSDVALSEFSINLSDGREFSTTTGSISVPATTGNLTISLPENSGASVPYFANTTYEHNVSQDLTIYVYPYTKINVSGNTTVSNFSVNGSSTTNGALYLRLFNDTYTFEAYDITDDNGADYANTTATYTASPYLQYYTYVPKYSNTINISFYDQETGVLLNGTTVYFEAISTSQSGNYTTSTGVLTESFLLPDTYTFRYNALGYEESFYSLTITDRSFNALNLTLLNSTSSTAVTLTVYDTLGNTLEDATVKVLRYDVATNTYYVTEILNTNFEGVAVANIVLNSEYYKFIIDYDGETRLTTSPTYIYGTTLTFYIPITSSGMADLFDQVAVSGTLTYNYATNIAVFTFTDTENTATQGCLYAYTRAAGTNTLVNSSCVSSSSGSLNLPAFNSSTTWVFEGKVTKGGNTYLISSYRVDFDTRLNETGSGALFAFLVLATVVFIGLFSLEVAVVLASAVPLLFTVTKLAELNYVISIPILLAGLVIAFIIGVNKK